MYAEYDIEHADCSSVKDVKIAMAPAVPTTPLSSKSRLWFLGMSLMGFSDCMRRAIRLRVPMIGDPRPRTWYTGIPRSSNIFIVVIMAIRQMFWKCM